MSKNFNRAIEQDIKNFIALREWNSLSKLRLEKGDPGAICYIDNLDLSGYNLGDLPTDFLCFRNCKLSNASFQGKQFFPLSLWNCDASKLDLRQTNGMLFAFRTDFSGAFFDETTVLCGENYDLPSAFSQCQMDKHFEQFVINSGALLEFPRNKNIGPYAFGVPDDELTSL